AAIVKPLHHLGEARAFGSQSMAERYSDVIEEERSSPDDVAPDILKRRARNSRRIERKKESADAMGSLLRLPRTRKDYRTVCLVSKAYGGLLPIQNVVIAIAICS